MIRSLIFVNGVEGYMLGDASPNLSPVFEKIPEKFEFQLLDENWEHFCK